MEKKTEIKETKKKDKKTVANASEKKETVLKNKKSKKIEKTVSAKKLPSMFKKQYTEQNFEKKILKKLYIEQDKDLLKGLFIPTKDKKGRDVLSVDLTKSLPKSQLAKLKNLSKQITQQKSGIKIVPLVAVVVLVAAIGICVTLFKNVIVASAIKSSMQGIFGAKTDIACVDFQIFNAKLQVLGLAQANKDEPMKNLFQIDDINVDFNLTDLLRGKFHAENLVVAGVALDTERTTSGALPIKQKKTKAEKKSESKISETRKKLMDGAAQQLSEMFENYNPEKFLENVQNELKSPTVAIEISNDVQKKVEKWKNTPTELQTSVTKFSTSVDSLVKTDWANVNDPVKLKAALENLNTSVAEGKKIKESLETTTNSLKTDVNAVSNYQTQLTNAIKTDTSLVDSKISEMKKTFSPSGLKQIMNNAVQSILYEICGKYYPYISKGLDAAMNLKNNSSKNSSLDSTSSKKSKEKTSKKQKKSSIHRMEGRTVYYKKDTVPKLLIENAVASGYEYGTQNLLFKGVASEISSDQNMTGKPTSISADFKVLGRQNNAGIIIDARKESSSLINASYNGKGYPVNADAKVFSLESNGDIFAKMTASDSGSFTISGLLDMKVNSMIGMEFEPARVSSLYRKALSNVKKLSVGFKIGLDSDGNLEVSLTEPEKLASQLVNPITQALSSEINTIAADAKKNITTLLSEKTGIAREQLSQFGDIQKSINAQKSKVDSLNSQLEAKKKKITAQITNAGKNSLKGAASGALKNLFQ